MLWQALVFGLTFVNMFICFREITVHLNSYLSTACYIFQDCWKQNWCSCFHQNNITKWSLSLEWSRSDGNHKWLRCARFRRWGFTVSIQPWKWGSHIDVQQLSTFWWEMALYLRSKVLCSCVYLFLFTVFQ